MRSTRAVCLVALPLTALLACADVMQRIPTFGLTGASGRVTEAELSEGLADWATRFASLVTAASDRIRSETTLRETRRNTLLWQLRILPLARRAAFQPDAQQAYITSLALASAHEEYLATGDGARLFGAQQPIAVEAARRLEQDVIELGSAFLTKRQLERLQTQVDELVASHPMRGVFAVDVLISGLTESTLGGVFGWVVDLPMVPFRALAGVTDTAQAVNNFNETARKFTETVDELPHQTRWELELLLYDAEELESVERALAAAESFALGAERISGAAQALPGELAARLEQARATIVEIDLALARAEALAVPLSHVADRIGDASTQWTELLASMQASDDKGAPGRPFDVREYEATAARIADAGRELRALVDDLRALEAGASTALLDAAAWRVALLILVFFAALAAYRFAASRWR